MNCCSQIDKNRIVLISSDRSLVGMGPKILSSCLIEQGFKTTIVLMESDGDDFRDFYWKDLDDICEGALLIGISCMTAGVKKAIEVKKHLECKNDVPIIVGGIHAALSPESLMNDFQVLCHGEGEDLIVDIAKRLSKNEPYSDIPGLWLKNDSTIIKNQSVPLKRDLNEYPFPDYDLSHQFILEDNRLVPIKPKPAHMRLESFSIMGSRGCPHNCTYCCSPKMIQEFPWQKKVRHYSIDYLISHLKEVHKIYPEVKRFWIEDDTFFAKSLYEILNFSQKYKSEVNIPFEVLISPWTFSDEKIKALIDAGMDKLIIGVQSGSENVARNIYNRNISSEKMLEIVKLLHKYTGMLVCYDFIVMNPFETQDDLIHTVKFIRSLPEPFVAYSNSLAFYPGTKLYDMALKAGINVKGRMEYTEITHGYKILKTAKMRHKIFHFIILLMGGIGNDVKIGRVRRSLITDRFISFYSFLDKRLSSITDFIVYMMASFFLFDAQFRKILKKILGNKIYSGLRSIYYKLRKGF